MLLPFSALLMVCQSWQFGFHVGLQVGLLQYTGCALLHLRLSQVAPVHRVLHSLSLPSWVEVVVLHEGGTGH